MGASVEAFTEALDEACAWRKKEVSELVQALRATEPGTQLNETLRRALALLLNAHWEALIKIAVDSYLDTARKIGEAEGLYEATAFRALAVEKAYEDAARREKKRQKGRLHSQDPASHPLADVLLKVEYDAGKLWSELPEQVSSRVGASLWWNRLEYLCGLIDVPIPRGIVDPTLINERVVQTRHRIAHGEDALPDSEELLDARDRVMRLIDAIVDEMQRSLAERRFAAKV
jgi:hypothetical protein